MRKIVGDKAALAIVDTLNGPAGQYYRAIVTVAMDGADEMGTVNYEAIHVLREVGVLKSAEWTALAKAAQADTDLMASIRRRYDGQGLSEDGLTEEAVGDMFSRYAAGTMESKGFVRTAFDRLREVLRSIGSALRGQGFTTAESVMRAGLASASKVRSGMQPRANCEGRPPLTSVYLRPFPKRSSPIARR